MPNEKVVWAIEPIDRKFRQFLIDALPRSTLRSVLDENRKKHTVLSCHYWQEVFLLKEEAIKAGIDDVPAKVRIFSMWDGIIRTELLMG